MSTRKIVCTHSEEFIGFAKSENDVPLDLSQLDMTRSEDATVAICLNHAKDLVSYERVEGMPPIHVGVIDDEGVNGSAIIRKGVAFLSITSGAIRVLFDAAFRLLAHPQTFPHIGNPAAEQDRQTWHDGLYDSYKKVIARRGTNLQLHDMYPKDEVRGEYAMQLGTAAFRYLILHEIAHIRRGHAGYYETRRGVHRMYEAGQVDKKVAAVDVQATEVDADRYAFCKTFLMLNETNGVLEVDENRTRGWLYSVSLFWWLFAADDVVDGDHPLPMLRVVGASTAVRAMIRSRLGDEALVTFDQWERNSLREFAEALVIIARPGDRLMKSLEMQMDLFRKGELPRACYALPLHLASRASMTIANAARCMPLSVDARRS